MKRPNPRELIDECSRKLDLLSRHTASVNHRFDNMDFEARRQLAELAHQAMAISQILERLSQAR